MNKYILIIASLFLSTACSGGGGFEAQAVGDGDGDYLTGGEGGSFSETDGGVEPGGRGGTDVDNGGVSAGGNTAGSAGETSMGGATGGVSAGGSGGEAGSNTGGSGTCIPKTCDELSYEFTGEYPTKQGTYGSACGVHDDGCGRPLFCDTCDSPGQECGGNIVVGPYSGTESTSTSPGTPGICSTGCYNFGNNPSVVFNDELFTNGPCGDDNYVVCPAGDGNPIIPPELEDKECEWLSIVDFCCAGDVSNLSLNDYF